MSYTDQIKNAFETVVETAKETNEFVIETGKVVVNEVTEAGEKWMALGKKAVDAGVKMVGEQQKLTLTAMEEVKGQLSESAKRFQKIVNS